MVLDINWLRFGPDWAFMQVGKVKVGSQHRVALQTMTTTDTRNIQATVDQVYTSSSVILKWL